MATEVAILLCTATDVQVIAVFGPLNTLACRGTKAENRNDLAVEQNKHGIKIEDQFGDVPFAHGDVHGFFRVRWSPTSTRNAYRARQLRACSVASKCQRERETVRLHENLTTMEGNVVAEDDANMKTRRIGTQRFDVDLAAAVPSEVNRVGATLSANVARASSWDMRAIDERDWQRPVRIGSSRAFENVVDERGRHCPEGRKEMAASGTAEWRRSSGGKETADPEGAWSPTTGSRAGGLCQFISPHAELWKDEKGWETCGMSGVGITAQERRKRRRHGTHPHFKPRMGRWPRAPQALLHQSPSADRVLRASWPGTGRRFCCNLALLYLLYSVN